ncbi:hypothetical protein [Bartonella gabonensis]|nr:hypothetical protein [Bartonella gabonensis]
MTNINNRIHDIEQSIFSSGLNWRDTKKLMTRIIKDKTVKLSM